jgi:hypothetical protein
MCFFPFLFLLPLALIFRVLICLFLVELNFLAIFRVVSLAALSLSLSLCVSFSLVYVFLFLSVFVGVGAVSLTIAGVCVSLSVCVVFWVFMAFF